jgi:hypothetical protein
MSDRSGSKAPETFVTVATIIWREGRTGSVYILQERAMHSGSMIETVSNVQYFWWVVFLKDANNKFARLLQPRQFRSPMPLVSVPDVAFRARDIG